MPQIDKFTVFLNASAPALGGRTMTVTVAPWLRISTLYELAAAKVAAATSGTNPAGYKPTFKIWDGGKILQPGESGNNRLGDYNVQVKFES